MNTQSSGSAQIAVIREQRPLCYNHSAAIQRKRVYKLSCMQRMAMADSPEREGTGRRDCLPGAEWRLRGRRHEAAVVDLRCTAKEPTAASQPNAQPSLSPLAFYQRLAVRGTSKKGLWQRSVWLPAIDLSLHYSIAHAHISAGKLPDHDRELAHYNRHIKKDKNQKQKKWQH